MNYCCCCSKYKVLYVAFEVEDLVVGAAFYLAFKMGIMLHKLK
jgi:hypothetical protein